MTNNLPVEPEQPVSAGESRDLQLMERLCSNDAAALDELIQLYWPAIVRYADRLLGGVDAAEDVAQQTFLRLWQRSGWQAGGSVRAYLYCVARNLAFDERRHRAVRQRWADVFRRQERSGPATPDQVAEVNALDGAVNAAIAALPERRREVFQLVRFHGLSYKEVAEVMGVSAQTVANQMSAALRDLRGALEPHLADEPALTPVSRFRLRTQAAAVARSE